jgi:hypothetical protein
MTEKQTAIVIALEHLVQRRFNKESLEKELSRIFGQPITLELGCEDVDYLSDWNYMFNVENDEIGGDFDIYVLMHRNKDIWGNTMYVTEVGYDFC